MKPNLKFEKKLWKQNIDFVIGIDEVGRGAFAGPIVGAGVVLPVINKITRKYKFLQEVNDSKLLDANKRKRLSKLIYKNSLYFAVEEVGITIINKKGIGFANKMVFRKVVKNLLNQINSLSFHLLSDAHRTKYIRGISNKNHTALIKGDRKSLTIAAASIIAKVHRDSLMDQYSKKYRNYDFESNKGYGTLSHRKALFKYGFSDIHRTSFELNKFLNR